MSHRQNPDEDATFRAASALLGLVLLTSAAIAFDFAEQHMAAFADLCGGAGHPHCGWCYAAAGFAAAGVAALVAAVRPTAARAPVRRGRARAARSCASALPWRTTP